MVSGFIIIGAYMVARGSRHMSIDIEISCVKIPALLAQ
jgi:hypothetical protein